MQQKEDSRWAAAEENSRSRGRRGMVWHLSVERQAAIDEMAEEEMPAREDLGHLARSQ